MLGASVRNPACGKGHEEGGLAYAKAGLSLRRPPILEHLPPKPESAYFTALCSHLHLWLYRGLSPTASLEEGVNLQLQSIKIPGCDKSVSTYKLLWRYCSLPEQVHLATWLFIASQPWEARDALNFLNTDYFEKLEIISIVGWLEIILVKGFHLLGQYLLLSLHIPCPYTH